METTETTQPSLDGLGVSDAFGVSDDFVIVTDPAAGPEATINERWYRLYSHSKAMCELMVAFNSELEPGYAPQGLGVAVHDQLSKLENLATAARILITPAIAATGEWKRDGAPNPERWFAGKTGKSPAKARAEMETGKNLENAPGTRKAFLQGEISAEQADTISDVADVNPEAEQALLDAAKKQSLKELKDEAARRKAEVEDMEQREKRIHKKRYVRTWTDREGAWNLHAKGTIPDGADFMSVLERLIDQQFKQARKTGVRGTRDNYAFDALMNMGAQHGYGNPGPTDPGPGDLGPGDLGPGDPGPTNPGTPGPGPSSTGPASPGSTNRGTAGSGPSDTRTTNPDASGPGPMHPGPDGPGPTVGAPGRRSTADKRKPSGRAKGKPTARRSAAPGFTDLEPLDQDPTRTDDGGSSHQASERGQTEAAVSPDATGLAASGSSAVGHGIANAPDGQSNVDEGGSETAVRPTDTAAPAIGHRPASNSESPAPSAGPQEALPSTTGRRSKQRSRRPVSQQQIYCIDWNALVRGRALTGERCELRGIGPVSVSVVRRALADASAKLVVTDGDGRALTVAHLGTGNINPRLIPGLTDSTRDGSRERRGGAGLFGDAKFERAAGSDGSAGTAGPLSQVDRLSQPAGAQRTVDSDAGGGFGTEPKLVIIGIKIDDLAVGDFHTSASPSSGELTSGRGHMTISAGFDELAGSGGPTIAIPGIGLVASGRATGLLGHEAAERLAARGQPVREIVHTGRAPNAAQRIALAWADTTCKVHGCPNQRVEIDHRTPWATERTTEIDNLDPLCSAHHDLKTNHGWQFIHPASRSFVPPDHPDHPGPTPSKHSNQAGR